MLERGTMLWPRRPWLRMQTSMVALAVQLSCMVLPWQLQGVLKADLLYKQFYGATFIDYPISILQLRTTYSVILLNNNTRRTVLYKYPAFPWWWKSMCHITHDSWCEWHGVVEFPVNNTDVTTAHARGRVLCTGADVCCIRFRCRLLSLVVYVWHRHVWICCNGYWHTVHLL